MRIVLWSDSDFKVIDFLRNELYGGESRSKGLLEHMLIKIYETAVTKNQKYHN